MVTGTAIKHLYVQSVHGARRALERRGASFSAPPPEKRWRHWAVSLTAIHDPGAMVGLGVPWWTYSAIAEVEAWLLRRRHPVRVFEYGSGQAPSGCRGERMRCSASSTMPASPGAWRPL